MKDEKDLKSQIWRMGKTHEVFFILHPSSLILYSYRPAVYSPKTARRRSDISPSVA